MKYIGSQKIIIIELNFVFITILGDTVSLSLHS